MRALVARISGKQSDTDPVNIHAVVFWSTIAFWAIAGTYLLVSSL